MSLRTRPIRSLLRARSLHTSTSLLQSEATPPAPAPPKPRSATDLGFGNHNAARVRDLSKIDLPTSARANISLGPDYSRNSRQAGSASPARSGPRPPPRAQRSGTYASLPKVNTAPLDGRATDGHPERAAPSDASSANNAARRRASLARVEIDDMEIPTIETGSAAQAPQRAAGSMPPRGPPRRAGGPPGGYRSGGPGGPGGARAGPGGARAGPGGARAGPGGARGQGGQRRTGGPQSPRKGKGPSFNLGEAQLQVMKERWEGAPIPPPPAADRSRAALFGNESVVGAFAPVPKTTERPLWAEGLSPEEFAKKTAERRMGSYETVLPSLPHPSQVAPSKTAEVAEATFAWQMALNPTVSMSADAKKVQAASEMVRKAVA